MKPIHDAIIEPTPIDGTVQVHEPNRFTPIKNMILFPYAQTILMLLEAIANRHSLGFELVI